MRLLLLLLCGCDQLFGIVPLADAAIDSPVFDASLAQLGCSDGTREAFVDLSSAPAIAGCSGAWTIGGVKPEPVAACGRRAGNGGANVLGTGCSATDLCAEGWHVCPDRFAVLARAPNQSCAGITNEPSVFFVTGQSGPGGGNCDPTGTDDVFGCGTLGTMPTISCTPLDRQTGNDCIDIRSGGWICNAPQEPATIYKTDPLIGGGVLCCRAEV